jgi:hypothetical protein
MHASWKGITDDTNDSFYKELEHVFSKFHIIIPLLISMPRREKILSRNLV